MNAKSVSKSAPPKAYSYIRFSSPEQAKGDSLRRQTEAARAWCEARGIALDDTLRDLGVSAFKGANAEVGALRAFLDLVEAGRVPSGSHLIVESLDRLSRDDVASALTQLIGLINAGVIVVTLMDGQVYSKEGLKDNWMPLMMSLVIMARAHEESKAKSERVGAAWRRKKDVAREAGKPLGKRAPGWLRVENGVFVEVPEKVAVVRRIFDMTIAGYGRRMIVKALNSDGIPSFRGGTWQTSTLGKILTGRAVLGEYEPHTGTHRGGNRTPDGDPIPGYYPAVVDEQTYWRAQSASVGRRIAPGRRGEDVVNIFQGLSTCECGATLHVVNKGKPPKGGTYLVCSSALRKTGCENGRHFRIDKLEKRSLEAIVWVNQSVFRGISGEAKPDAAAEHLVAVRAKLADAEARRDRLMVLVETGDEAALARFKVLAEEVKFLKGEAKTAKAAAAVSAADPGVSAHLADATVLRDHMASATPDERRDLRVRLSELLRAMQFKLSISSKFGAVISIPRPQSFTVGNPGHGADEVAIWIDRETISVLVSDEDHRTTVLFLRGDPDDPFFQR